jgi:hypothetical protein
VPAPAIRAGPGSAAPRHVRPPAQAGRGRGPFPASRLVFRGRVGCRAVAGAGGPAHAQPTHGAAVPRHLACSHSPQTQHAAHTCSQVSCSEKRRRTPCQRHAAWPAKTARCGLHPEPCARCSHARERDSPARGESPRSFWISSCGVGCSSSFALELLAASASSHASHLPLTLTPLRLSLLDHIAGQLQQIALLSLPASCRAEPPPPACPRRSLLRASRTAPAAAPALHVARHEWPGRLPGA